jgi:ribosomal protein S18 acetylase RimI-like enzyme
MKNHILSRLLFIVFFSMASLTFAAAIDLQHIDIQPLSSTESDKQWFVEEYTNAFFQGYKNKHLALKTKTGYEKVGPTDDDKKKSWLKDTAETSFERYVEKPTEGYQAASIFLEKKRVGALLFRIMKDNIVYLGEMFVMPEYQKKGIAEHVINSVLPGKVSPLKRYEVLFRYQNDAASRLYKKTGFTRATSVLVTKYDYPTMYYIAYFKDLE